MHSVHALLCDIAMMIVCVLINDAKTLEYDHWSKKRERRKIKKNTNHLTYVLMAIFANS
jgi:hypothetical protein